MALLNIAELCFQYESSLILDRIQLEMEAGEIILLLGPNGCGKTTLLDCIIGYKQSVGGIIKINGIDAKSYSVKEKAKHIAYVPQSSSNIFPYSVMEMVLMGRTPYLGSTSSPSPKDVEVALDAMETLGISKFKDRTFSTLSGGEKQLVFIARALAQDSQIILLDEPTSSLDIKNEMMVLSKIKKLASSKNKSLLIATHQPNHVYYLSEENIPVKAALFADRRIKYFGTPAEVVNEYNIKEVYRVNCDIYEYKNNHKTIIVTDQ